MGARGLYLDAFTIWRPDASFNHDVTAERGLSEGGGSGWTQGRLATLDDLKNDPAVVYEESPGSSKPMFYFTEGPQEMFIKRIPLNYGAGLEFNHPAPVRYAQGNTPKHLIAPMFETVYHDYHLTAHPLQVVASVEFVSSGGTPVAFRTTRMEYASRLFFGHSLTGGSSLSPDLINTVRVAMTGLPTPRYEYVYWTDMIRNFTELLKLDVVRDFTIFGERMRDPIVSNHATIQVTADDWVPYDATQPFVYVNAHRRFDEAQQRYAVGLLFLNWTHSSDPAGTGPAGSQHISVTFNPQDYGLTGTYQRYEVVGESQILLGPTVVAGTAPITHNNVFVPALGARFYWYLPIP